MQGNWTDASQEVWECTVRVDLLAAGGTVALDQVNWLGEIKSPLQTWFGAITSFINPKAQLQQIKGNQIGPDGKYADPHNSNTQVYPPGVVGNVANTQVGPNFLSMVTSWQTAKSRGTGAHGRIYLPNNCFPMNDSFQISTTNRDKIPTAGKALLVILGNAGSATANRKAVPVVASRKDATLTPINGVSGNSVYDVQRRRKNRIDGTRSAFTAYP